MVSGISIFAMTVSLILCFGTPVILFILVRKRANKLLTPVVAGVTGFFVMQIIIRIPLLSVLQLYTPLYEVNIFLLALILGLSAALFETFGRVMTVKLFLRDDTRFTSGVVHGIGHGGIEAIMLVGMTYITNLIFSIMINSGTFFTTLGSSEAMIDARDALVDTPYYLFFLGGVERVLAIIFHIALSVLVVYAFKIGKKWPVWLVIGVHAFLDTMVVLLGYYGVDVFIIELFILVLTLIMVYMTFNIYQQYKLLKDEEMEGESNV